MSVDDLDDDRRDIAVLGDLDAARLNRMARRNRGADPLEVSGDALARTQKTAPDGSPRGRSERHATCKPCQSP